MPSSDVAPLDGSHTIGATVVDTVRPPGSEQTHVELDAVTLRYGSTAALTEVSLTIHRGTVHALLGENGAGKSTLGSIIAGLRRPSSGTVRVNDHTVSYRSPREALNDHIALVAQEIALVPRLTVSENALLGVRGRRARKDAAARLQQYNDQFCNLDLASPAGELRTGEQQQVEILRALVRDAQLIVMDEPTSALAEREAKRLIEIVKALRSAGITIVYVSHHLEEVLEIADTATILRNGQVVRTGPISGTTVESLLSEMVGQSVSTAFPARTSPCREEPPRLAVEGLSRADAFSDVTFSVAPGEILGLGGLLGSGRSEIARVLAGIDAADAGVMRLDGASYAPNSAAKAIASGVAFVPESRKAEGLLLNRSLTENISLPRLREVARRGWIPLASEWKSARASAQSVDVRPLSRTRPVASLSGGNQQKVMFARWIESEPKLFVIDEPTRGVDMAARLEIYRAIVRAADAGAAVVLISSELEELVGLADRVLVLWRGQISAELSGDGLTGAALSELAQTGGEALSPPSSSVEHESGKGPSRTLDSPRSRSLLAGVFGAGGGALTLTLLLSIILAATSPYFLREGNILNLLDSYAPIALVAAGMAFVIVAGQFDLSVAAVFPAAGITGAAALETGWPAPLALLAGAGVGLLIGVVNGLIVTRLHIHSFVATLAMSLAVAGTCLALTGGQIMSVDDPFMRELGARSQSVLVPGPSVFVAALIILVLTFVLARTQLGTSVYAVGGNSVAARIAGVRVNVVVISAFAVSAVLAALAGLMSLARVSGAHVDNGSGLELTAITAVVLGGTSISGGHGGPGRTVAGVALLAVIANTFNLFQVDLQFQALAVGLVMLVAVGVDARMRAHRA